MTVEERRKLIETVRRIPEGRELLDELDSFCGYKRAVFHPTNERQNAFNQGKQAVAVWLHAEESRKVIKSKKVKSNEMDN